MADAKLDLSHAVPTETLKVLVPASRFVVVAKTVKEWRANKPNQVPSTSLFIWDEMVHRGATKQPMKLAPIINKDFKGIYEAVQKELGAAPVTSAYAVSVYDGEAEDSFADISLVRCYPSDIHICDVEFSDFSKPLPPNDPSRRYRGYRSLGLFNEFLERLIEVARSQGAKRLSLMVAHPPLHAVFARHGFEPSSTQMAQQALAMSGSGFAMIRNV